MSMSRFAKNIFRLDSIVSSRWTFFWSTLLRPLRAERHYASLLGDSKSLGSPVAKASAR